MFINFIHILLVYCSFSLWHLPLLKKLKPRQVLINLTILHICCILLLILWLLFALDCMHFRGRTVPSVSVQPGAPWGPDLIRAFFGAMRVHLKKRQVGDSNLFKDS